MRCSAWNPKSGNRPALLQPSGLHNPNKNYSCTIRTLWECRIAQNQQEGTNVGQSYVNLSLLALPCSRIPLVHDGVYCLSWCGWALICLFWYPLTMGGSIGSCLLSGFLLLSTRYVRYLMTMWWMVFIVFIFIFWLVMWGYVLGSQGDLCFLCEWLPLLMWCSKLYYIAKWIEFVIGVNHY